MVSQFQRGDDERMLARQIGDELKQMNFGSNVNNTAKTQSNKRSDESLSPNRTTPSDASLSDDAKFAVHSINKARAGLRHEIKNLSAMSEKTGEQLTQLDKTLSLRAGKLLDMTNDIDKKAASLEASSSKIANLAVTKQSEIAQAQASSYKNVEAALMRTDSITGGLDKKIDAKVEGLNDVLSKLDETLLM